MDHSGLGSVSKVVYSLNFNLVLGKCGRSRHDELGAVGHSRIVPTTALRLLPPHDLIVEPWTVGLEARQRLRRRKI